MEQEKNNKGIIALLVVLVVFLAVLCVLFATGTISFNSKAVENEGNQTNNGEIIKNLTEVEAITAVKNVFTNDTVQYLVDLISVTYCKSEVSVPYVSEKELGLDYESNGYYKCDDFKSYNELVNFFKQYVTDEYFNKRLLSEPYLKQSTKMSDGKIHYNYYEKDGSMYNYSTGKGSNVNKYKLLIDETVYKIDSFNNNQITATITAKWETGIQTKYTELVKISLINDNGNWKVNFYESNQI